MASLYFQLVNVSVRGFPILLLFSLLAPTMCQAGSYSQKKAIHDTLLASSNYNPHERPVLDQEDILYVDVGFALVSIVEINDVVQSFKCNGFLALNWNDEILRWNSADYGGEAFITPKISSVFRPRLVMMNTMGERDLFEDDYSPLGVSSNGDVSWAPGSIFPSACNLDLTKYPFDEQHCEIEMIDMNYDSSLLVFRSSETAAGERFFTKNGQWDVSSMVVSTPIRDIGNENKSSIILDFHLKRKPTFLVISMLLPIVFLSLLNLMVFLIPVDSGEKISYGITVLLALSVFMSIMSSMLPSSSESMPLMISYIFILMTISVLTVVDSIIIVFLHHMEEKEEKWQKAKASFKSTLPKISLLKKAVTPIQQGPNIAHKVEDSKERGLKTMDAEVGDPFKANMPGPIFPKPNEEVKVNKYKLIGKHIDMVSFVVFGVLWVSVTIGFMSAIAS